MKRILSFMLACLMVIGTSCKEDDPGATPVQGVAISKATITLEPGKTETLSAVITPSDAADKSVTWSSSDAAIATVDAKGVVTAVKAGTATITVASVADNSKKATCAVTVENSVVPVAKVELNKTELSLEVGKEETLTATVTPDNATDKTVTWSTSDATIATVTDGKITAVKEGTVTITATAGEQTATCEVTVTPSVLYAWYAADKTATSFEISSVDELKGLANLVNGNDLETSGVSGRVDFSGKTITLKAGIELNLNDEEWAPIGLKASTPFRGVFDGNGNKITGLKINNNDPKAPVGFFGYIHNAFVKNLKIEGGSVTGGMNSGSITGESQTSTIENCSSSAVVSGLQAGGIVGYVSGSSILACYATGNVSGIETEQGDTSTGGVVGYVSSGNNVQACYYTTGTVTGGKASGNAFTGGVVGFSTWRDTSIKNCYSTGTIVSGTGAKSYNGGVIGFSQMGENNEYLLYATGKGTNQGIGEYKTDPATVKSATEADILLNIDWQNTNLPGETGWSFNADGTLKKAE